MKLWSPFERALMTVLMAMSVAFLMLSRIVDDYFIAGMTLVVGFLLWSASRRQWYGD